MKKQRNYGGWGVIRERCMGGRGGGIVELEKGKRRSVGLFVCLLFFGLLFNGACIVENF